MLVDPNAARAIFMTALDKIDPAERAAYLAEACDRDDRLRQRVEVLLKAHDDPGSFLESPSPQLATTVEETQVVEKPGKVIGPYKLLEQIGEGGFGVVFMAEQQEPLRRRVALKVIKPGMDGRQVIARFEAERQALALMDHPNIAKVFDAGETTSGRPYFVMELVKGLPITEFCDQAKLPPRDRLELFASVCQAVQHAHQKGIIHRDIKPSNVLITLHDGKPVAKVIDFGIAKATGVQLTEKTLFTNFAAMIGTPLYMSPEQAGLSGLDTDTRSDIYSLGVLLYELLTGTTPFNKDRFQKAAYDEIRRIIREEEPPKPSTRLSDSKDWLASISANRHMEPAKLTKLVRGELDWIVMKALEKDRNRRYETANGFAADVQRYLADEPVQACPPSAGYRLRKFVRRNKGAFVAACLVAVALLGGIIGTTVGMVQAEQAKETAENRLIQIEKGIDILGSIFDKLHPRSEEKEGQPLRTILGNRLDQAAADLEGEAVGDPLLVAGLQMKLAQAQLGLGYPEKAIALFLKARATFTRELGIDHRDTLSSMNGLGESYLDAARFDLALPLFEETLRRRKNTLGPDHPHTIQSMNNLAIGHDCAGNLDLVLPLLEETLRVQTAKLGATHPDTLICMFNLAAYYHTAGKQNLALPLHEETLKLRTTQLGADHPDTLQSMSSVGLGYQQTGRHDLAMPLLEQTLRLRQAKLGSEHPHTLLSMNNLAMAYRKAGRNDLAVSLLEETLKLTTAKRGPDHTDTFSTMENLALAYHASDKLDLALPLYEETLQLRKAKLGPDHPDVLNSMNNLAALYWNKRMLDRSIPLFEEVLLLQRRKLGEEHHKTLTTAANLGVNYRDAGRLKEALPLLEEAYRKGRQHASLAWVALELVSSYIATGHPAEATALLKEELASARRRLSADSTELGSILTRVGSQFLELKRYAEAEDVLRESLTLREKKQPSVWTTFDTKSTLGAALLGQKKYTEAEPLLLAGYEGMKQREAKIPLHFRQVRLPEALDRLVQLYDAWDKKYDATKWRKELEAQKQKESGIRNQESEKRPLPN